MSTNRNRPAKDPLGLRLEITYEVPHALITTGSTLPRAVLRGATPIERELLIEAGAIKLMKELLEPAATLALPQDGIWTFTLSLPAQDGRPRAYWCRDSLPLDRLTDDDVVERLMGCLTGLAHRTAPQLQAALDADRPAAAPDRATASRDRV